MTKRLSLTAIAVRAAAEAVRDGDERRDEEFLLLLNAMIEHLLDEMSDDNIFAKKFGEYVKKTPFPPVRYPGCTNVWLLARLFRKMLFTELNIPDRDGKLSLFYDSILSTFEAVFPGFEFYVSTIDSPRFLFGIKKRKTKLHEDYVNFVQACIGIFTDGHEYKIKSYGRYYGVDPVLDVLVVLDHMNVTETITFSVVDDVLVPAVRH